ncbi:MAG: Ig-like domain-containing protein [Bacteroidales bacterium]|nr:Ig-like domain-containing protein [Bacteroidales bacterium]
MKNRLFSYLAVAAVLLTGCDSYNRTDAIPSFTVTKTSLNIFVGDVVKIDASPTNQNYTWTSEVPEVATVSNTGEVTALSAGTTDIIVSSADATIRIPVIATVKIPLTDLVLNYTDPTLQVTLNGTYSVNATKEPSDANDVDNVVWTSSNPDVATVSSLGVISGLGLGYTTITCTLGNFVKSIDVEVIVTTSTPFRGPHILSASTPLEFPCIDFDMGGEGIAFHDTNSNNDGGVKYRANYGDPNGGSVDIGGDYAIGWTNNGEWWIYTLQVEDAGYYKVEMESSNNSATSFNFEFDAVVYPEYISRATGGWAAWTWMEYYNVYLTEGKHWMKIVYNSGGSNLRTLRFTYVP